MSRIGSPRPWLAGCVLVLAACGARDDLPGLDGGEDGSGGAGAGPGGTGGSGPTSAGFASATSSTATTGASTGAGGDEPVPRCDGLEADPPISHPPTGTDAQHEHEPGLVRIDAERVMLFAGVVDTLATTETLVATTFEPWGVWPSALGAALPIARGLRAGSIEASNGDGTASLLLPLFSLGQEGATTAFLAPRIEPSTASTDPAGSFLFELVGSGLPGYLRRTSEGFAAGWVSDFGGTSYLGQLRADARGNAHGGGAYESGCATSPVRADALEAGDHVLRAFSSGRDFGTCLNDDGIPGPGVRLQTAVVGPDDFVVLGEERVVAEPIAFVALVPCGADGAWLMFRTDGSTSFAPPPLLALPLDASGRSVGEPITLFDSALAGVPVAVAPFGAGFAAAWLEMGETAAVSVRVFDLAGNLLGGGGFDASPIAIGDRLTLLASDAADALLVGWTHLGDRAHVTRLRCTSDP